MSQINTVTHNVKIELSAIFGYGQGYSVILTAHNFTVPVGVEAPKNHDEFISYLDEYCIGVESFLIHNGIEQIININVINIFDIEEMLITFKYYKNDELVKKLITDNPLIFNNKSIEYRTKIDILHALINANLDGSIEAYNHITQYSKDIQKEISEINETSIDIHDKFIKLKELKSK